MNRRLSLLAFAPLLVLPSCSAFKLSENAGASSRTSFGRSVAEGRGTPVATRTTEQSAPAPAVAPAPVVTATIPAPVVTPPAPAMKTPVEKVVQAPAPSPEPAAKPVNRPAPSKRPAGEDADQLRLPGDLLNQLPGEKDYKPSNSGTNDGAPVIAKPPGSR